MNPRKLFVSACMLIIMSASVAYAGFAPLNPAFVEWQKGQAEKNSSEVPDVSASSSSSSSSSHPKGYVPGPVNLSHLAANPPMVFGAETLPVSYDLVAMSRDTPVRDQDWLGTCWAFGSIVPLESNYLTHLQQ